MTQLVILKSEFCMKCVLVILILVLVSGCTVLTNKDHTTLRATLQLNKKGWERVKAGSSVPVDVLILQNEKALRVLEE